MTKYKYPKSWFKYNLIPVPTGSPSGNCSACLFRNNAPKYCDCLACVYVDMSSETEYMESVYWIGRETHANIGTWTELNNFFKTTPKQRIRDISNDVMTKAVLAKKAERNK